MKDCDDGRTSFFLIPPVFADQDGTPNASNCPIFLRPLNKAQKEFVRQNFWKWPSRFVGEHINGIISGGLIGLTIYTGYQIGAYDSYLNLFFTTPTPSPTPTPIPAITKKNIIKNEIINGVHLLVDTDNIRIFEGEIVNVSGDYWGYILDHTNFTGADWTIEVNPETKLIRISTKDVEDLTIDKWVDTNPGFTVTWFKTFDENTKWRFDFSINLLTGETRITENQIAGMKLNKFKTN